MEEIKLEGMLESIIRRTTKKHTFFGVTYREETSTTFTLATAEGTKTIEFNGPILDISIGSDVIYLQTTKPLQQLLFDRKSSLLYCTY